MENHQQKPFASYDAQMMAKPTCQAQVISSILDRGEGWQVLSILVIESNNETSLKLLRTFYERFTNE